MNAKQLRDSILQYAMQGKLVPQVETDEPALKLVERIKAEKELLIQQKVIKKEKLLPPIMEEEIPFDIPETWEWVRLGEITKIIGDGMHGTPTYDNSGEFYFINGSNLKKDSIIINDATKRISLEVFEANKKLLDEATILMSINGTLGSLARYKFEPVMLGKSAAYITLVNKDYLEFIYLFFQSEIFKKYYEKKYTGTTIKNIPLKALRECPIPLPPLQEQERIVEKVLSVKTQVEIYEKKHKELQLKTKNFPNQLEKSILQYAMQGKLVEQDPNDEPAQQLIEKIQFEKERLIKEKVIKKEKPLPPITDEEILFDIPSSWKWVRLGEIGISNIGVTYKPNSLSDKGVPILRANNIQGNKICLEDLIYIDSEVRENQYVKKGDILICVRNGSSRLVGKSAIVNIEGMAFGAFMAKFSSVCNPYIQLFLTSNIFREQLTSAKTTTINQITQSVLKNVLIPLPPLNEQNRIVKEVEKLIRMKEQLIKKIQMD